MKVSKFGGSSVANAEMLKKVANIIQADEERKFVVVSAPGKRFDGDHKVTDLFIELLNQFTAGVDYQETLTQVTDRFRMITQIYHYRMRYRIILKKRLWNYFL